MKDVRSSGYCSVGRSRWDVGESTCGILIGKPEGKSHLKDLGVNGRSGKLKERDHLEGLGVNGRSGKSEGKRPLAIPRRKWKVGESCRKETTCKT